MENRVCSFEPVVSAKTRVLILGSMPGEASLKAGQYYAHPRNHFWRIFYAVWQTPLDLNYEARLAFLLERGCGLWDVAQSCERLGSLDSAIKNERVNDFEWLFLAYPQIERVLFNGAKAYEIFRRRVGFDQYPRIQFVKLGSTSPARATATFEEKKKEWEAYLCGK